MENYQIRGLDDAVRNVTEAEVEQLFEAGEVYVFTACRVQGNARWQTVNELFPLLKYGTQPIDNHRISQSRIKPSKASMTALWAIVIASAVGGAACFASVMYFYPGGNELPASVQFGDEILIAPHPLTPAATPIRIEPRPPSNPRPTNVVTRDPTQRPQTLTRTQPRPPAQPPQAIAPIQPPVAQAETLAQRRRRNEFQVPKNQWVDTADYGSPGLQLKVVNDTPISVTVDYGMGGQVRYEKDKGFEGDNFTSLRNGIIYVDSVRSSPGKVILTTDR